MSVPSRKELYGRYTELLDQARTYSRSASCSTDAAAVSSAIMALAVATVGLWPGESVAEAKPAANKPSARFDPHPFADKDDDL